MSKKTSGVGLRTDACPAVDQGLGTGVRRPYIRRVSPYSVVGRPLAGVCRCLPPVGWLVLVPLAASTAKTGALAARAAGAVGAVLVLVSLAPYLWLPGSTERWGRAGPVVSLGCWVKPSSLCILLLTRMGADFG